MTRRRPGASYEGDPLIPIMNLVCMLIPLLLYGAVFVKFVTIEVNAPKIVPDTGPKEISEKLNLTVMVTDQGFHFKVNPKYLQPWMTAANPQGASGPDIPKKDDALDFKTLNQKLLELKQATEDESSIIIGAEDDISYETLIKIMDYSRGTPDEPLFPVVTLTRGIV